MNFLKRLSLSIVLFAAVYSSAFSQAYKISVRVKGLKDTVCYLAHHFGDKQLLDDTARVDSKGLMVFEGKKPLHGGIYLVVLPGKKYFEFLVNEQNFSMETDTLDYVANMKLKNTLENDLFFDYLKYIQPRGEKITSLIKQLSEAKTKADSSAIQSQIEIQNKEVFSYRENVVKGNPSTFVATLFKAMTVKEPTKEEEEAAKAKGDKDFKFNFYRAHFFDNVNFSDGRITYTPIYQQKLKEYITNLTYPNIDSLKKACDWVIAKSRANKEDVFKFTLWYLTNHHETSPLMGADAVYVYLGNKYYRTGQAFWVDSVTLKKIIADLDIKQNVIMGVKPPQLILADSNNQYHALYNVKAKYTIVYFWDPNCGHCQKETPKLYEMYKKYKQDGLEVFAVDIDHDKKRWSEYVKKNDLRWINVYDPDHRVSFRTLYDIYSTPVIYLLNDKKEIIAKRLGVDQLDEYLGNAIKYEKEKNIQK